jgi:hypothetical protein
MYDGQVAGLELNVDAARARISSTVQGIDASAGSTSLSPMPGALMNAGLDALASALKGSPPKLGALSLQFPEKFNDVAFIFNTLIDLKERGVVGEVITPHRTYPSVYITGIEMNRDATTGDGAPITIELKEIRIVEAKMITAPIPTEPRGKTMVNKGRQPTSFVRDPAQKRSQFHKHTKG